MLSGDRAAIGRLSVEDLIKIAAATLTGMDVETFEQQATAWIDDARDPRWKRPYTELIYLRRRSSSSNSCARRDTRPIS